MIVAMSSRCLQPAPRRRPPTWRARRPPGTSLAHWDTGTPEDPRPRACLCTTDPQDERILFFCTSNSMSRQDARVPQRAELGELGELGVHVGRRCAAGPRRDGRRRRRCVLRLGVLRAGRPAAAPPGRSSGPPDGATPGWTRRWRFLRRRRSGRPCGSVLACSGLSRVAGFGHSAARARPGTRGSPGRGCDRWRRAGRRCDAGRRRTAQPRRSRRRARPRRCPARARCRPRRCRRRRSARTGRP